MTSIDGLFKKPSLPNQKRKRDTSRDPVEIYKSMRLNEEWNARRNSQVVPVDDEPEEDNDIAGPEMPPDLADDDEDGRFFGGGITTDTATVLDFIDERDKNGLGKAENIDSAWVRRLALNFEKKVSKNAELRAKFETEPQKFMSSEADLDAEIKALSILSEHPELYEEFARLGCVASLVSLLSHENLDVAIDAIEIISELTDENVEAESSQWDALVDALVDAQLLDLLHQNLSRFSETVDSDRAGVYHVLGVLENLSSRVSLAELIGGNQSIIPWLISRARLPEIPVGQNKQYAAEVLAILLQSSQSNRRRFAELDGIDIFLQLLSSYRKRDPERGTEEEEFVENLFDCLICSVEATEGKLKFLDAEGIELCLIMLKEGKTSRPRALRLLDHSLSGLHGSSCCERLVEAGGLKIIFTIFMKRQDTQSTEHFLGILFSMLRSLPADAAPRIRLLGKFVEKNYEKIERLIKLRQEYSSKLSVVDREIKLEQHPLSASEQHERAAEWLSRRMDAGLFSLQTVDVILAWLIAEDDGAKAKIRELMGSRDESLVQIRKTLQEQLDGMDEREVGEDPTLKDILGTLVGFL